jgi:hypothetical protein
MKAYGRGPKNTGNIFIQPGTALDVAVDQSATLTEVWKGEWQALVEQTPTKNAHHSYFTDLLLASKKIVLGRLGQATATLVYKGLDPSRDKNTQSTETGYPEVDKELSTDVTEFPIQTHPNFSSLVDAAGGAIIDEDGKWVSDGTGKAVFDDKTGEFICFGPQSGGDLAGVKSYYVPNKVETNHWYSDEQADRLVGEIVGGAMRVSLKSTRQGPVWKNSETLRYGTWNTLIY